VGIDKNAALADARGMNADILATIATLLIMAGLMMLMLDAVLGKDDQPPRPRRTD